MFIEISPCTPVCLSSWPHLWLCSARKRHQVCDEYFTKMRRQVYQTPKSYLSFLQLYKAMYKEKINELKVSDKNDIIR